MAAGMDSLSKVGRRRSIRSAIAAGYVVYARSESGKKKGRKGKQKKRKQFKGLNIDDELVHLLFGPMMSTSGRRVQ